MRGRPVAVMTFFGHDGRGVSRPALLRSLAALLVLPFRFRGGAGGRETLTPRRSCGRAATGSRS